MDEAARTVTLIVFAGAVLALGLGGAWTPVAGRWRDGGRLLVLRQTLFYLRGHGEVAGGLQIYRGVALFGRVWLWRHDYGPRHLQALGFAPAQLAGLEGQVTGLFRFRLARAAAQAADAMARAPVPAAAASDDAVGECLVGTFSGKRFTFAGARLQQAHFVPPEDRSWQRAASA